MSVGIYIDISAFLGLPIPFLMLGMGILSLTSFSYKVLCSETGISMSFVFREVHVPWENVDYHRNVAFRGKINGGANVWVLLKYRRQSDMRTHRALLLLPSVGPVVGWSAKEYTTELSRYIPS
jgi:hypothetical protein